MNRHRLYWIFALVLYTACGASQIQDLSQAERARLDAELSRNQTAEAELGGCLSKKNQSERSLCVDTLLSTDYTAANDWQCKRISCTLLGEWGTVCSAEQLTTVEQYKQIYENFSMYSKPWDVSTETLSLSCDEINTQPNECLNGKIKKSAWWSTCSRLYQRLIIFKQYLDQQS